MNRPNQHSKFEAITKSPKALAEFLMKLDIPDAPWDTAFQAAFCQQCPYENCPDVCPFEAQRYNPEWWLRMPEN